MGWADNGKTVVWADGSTFFRIPLSQIEFEPPKTDESKPDAKESPKPSAKNARGSFVRKVSRRQRPNSRRPRKP